MTKVAIFASGSGSNFENIVLKVDKGELNNIEITSLYTDHLDAYCIERAKQLKVAVNINEPKDFDSKSAYEHHLIRLLEREEVEWIILAGYMRLIGPDLLDAYEGKILNIHPSLLPKYKGKMLLVRLLIVVIMLQDQQFIMLIVAWIREKLLNKDNARSNRMIPKKIWKNESNN